MLKRANESSSSALACFLEIFFFHVKIMKLKNKIKLIVNHVSEISLNSKSTQKVEPRGSNRAPSTGTQPAIQSDTCQFSVPSGRCHTLKQTDSPAACRSRGTQSQQDLVLSLEPRRLLKCLSKRALAGEEWTPLLVFNFPNTPLRKTW